MRQKCCKFGMILEKYLMKRGYIGLWCILVASLIFFVVTSSMDTITIGNLELRNSGIMERLTLNPDSVNNGNNGTIATDTVPQVHTMKQTVDTTAQTILFIGDSMLEGLSPRMAAYAKENGHKMYTVVWYSSTSNVWGSCDTLRTFIRRFKPTYILLCLGANELFVKDIEKKRDRYVKTILKQIGDIPYLWIGPPNWKPDTGINRLIASNVREGSFFLSDGMEFDRTKDGAHPTRSSAAQWMDSIVRWMPRNAAHIIRLDLPQSQSARPDRVVVLQPKR